MSQETTPPLIHSSQPKEIVACDNALTRGMVAEVVHPNGYRERVKARATRVERLCDMCEATIPKGELCGVQAPGLFNGRFCWRCCEPVPAAAVERERAERQAIAEQHELAFARQLQHAPWGGFQSGEGIVFWQQFNVGHWRWDFLIAGKHGKVLVDIQGATKAGHKGAHTSHAGYTRDCRKLAYAVTQGWRALFVTGAMVQDGTALEIVERVLATEQRAEREGIGQ